MSRGWRCSWIAALVLIVFPSFGFARDLTVSSLDYTVVTFTLDAQAPPAFVAPMPQQAAALTYSEKTTGATALDRMHMRAAQVDTQIVGAERAQRNWLRRTYST